MKQPHKEVCQMNFDKLTSGATVRYAVIDGVKYLSIRDLIMVICEKDMNMAAEYWRRMNFQTKYDIEKEIKSYKFPGRGQQDQPVVSIEAAAMILSFLPGDKAKHRRATALEILGQHSNSNLYAAQFKKKKSSAPEAYVYLFQSAAFPEYVKIGRTQNIKTRLVQINCSMPIHPYELVTYFTSFDPVRDEAEAHEHFKNYRVAREFFKISKEEVIPYFLAKQNNLIHTQAPDEDYYSE